jgi:hypothetical protein
MSTLEDRAAALTDADLTLSERMLRREVEARQAHAQAHATKSAEIRLSWLATVEEMCRRGLSGHESCTRPTCERCEAAEVTDVASGLCDACSAHNDDRVVI